MENVYHKVQHAVYLLLIFKIHVSQDIFSQIWEW